MGIALICARVYTLCREAWLSSTRHILLNWWGSGFINKSGWIQRGGSISCLKFLMITATRWFLTNWVRIRLIFICCKPLGFVLSYNFCNWAVPTNVILILPHLILISIKLAYWSLLSTHFTSYFISLLLLVSIFFWIAVHDSHALISTDSQRLWASVCAWTCVIVIRIGDDPYRTNSGLGVSLAVSWTASLSQQPALNLSWCSPLQE